MRHESRASGLPLALAALLAGGLGTWAVAAPPDEREKKVKDHTAGHLETDEPAVSEAEAASRPASHKGMQVYVDPKNGKLRQPTREEQQALSDEIARLTNRSSEGLQAVTYPDGTIGLDLQGRFLSVSVARINPDGTVSTDCVTAPPAPASAAGKASAPPSKPAKPAQTQAKKEVRIER